MRCPSHCCQVERAEDGPKRSETLASGEKEDKERRGERNEEKKKREINTILHLHVHCICSNRSIL